MRRRRFGREPNVGRHLHHDRNHIHYQYRDGGPPDVSRRGANADCLADIGANRYI